MTLSRKALREATSNAHDRVDAAFGRFDVTDRAGYAAFLAAHAAIVWPLEAALDRAAAIRVAPDWPERKRGAALREDLAFLRDVPLPPLDEEQVDMGHLNSEAAIAGTLYVLEGSRLGGRFIARQLPSGFPRAYLDGDQRTDKWQQLMLSIDAILNSPSALQTAIAAAHLVFSAFEHSALRRAAG